MSGETFPHFATNAIHIGSEPENWDHRAVVPPIVTSTTFKQTAPGETVWEYGRGGNPTRNALESCLATLENAKHAMTFSSGLATLDALVHVFTAGDEVICMDDMYGGTHRYFERIGTKMGLKVKFVDFSSKLDFDKLISEQTKLVWVETPTNPTLKVSDIALISSEVHRLNKSTIVAVDNTFMTPYFQRPLDLGADCVIHSCTKYLNGHSDVIMGCLMTSNEALAKELRFHQMAIGAVPSPWDCYLLHRGLKTLALRMKQHMINGMAVAKFLETHSTVEKVLYPGLKCHPQSSVCAKQMKGFSGMIAFYIKGGLEQSRTFLKALKVFCLAESLGGFESLAELPSVMTHASVPLEKRQLIGVTDNLIRLSVGVEDVEDLIADLDQALKKAAL